MYIYLVFGMSLSLLIYQLFELYRTELWAGLLVFDVFDMRSMIVAASAGGDGIAKCIEGAWVGNWDDKAVAAIAIRFCAPDVESSMPAIVAAEDGRGLGGGLWRKTAAYKGLRGVDGEVSEREEYLLEDRGM